jgi:aromatic ring-opening dioxygenase LigB subunit
MLADLSATRSLQAPGFYDDRAAKFDAEVVLALAQADAHSLERLDVDLGDQLMAAGVRSLKALGAMVRVEKSKGAVVAANIGFDAAPLGVGYVVANWNLT